MSDAGWTDFDMTNDASSTPIPYFDNLATTPDYTPDYTGPLSPDQSTWNPGDDTSSSTSPAAFDPNMLLKLVQSGVDAYGKIEQINHGGYAQYASVPPHPAYQPPAPASPPSSASPSGGFDWSKLKDFTTPYPYAIGLGTLFVGIVVIRAVSRR